MVSGEGLGWQRRGDTVFQHICRVSLYQVSDKRDNISTVSFAMVMVRING